MQIIGIMGEVGDKSEYKIDCVIECSDSHQNLSKFKRDSEFLFAGGATVRKGKLDL